MTRDLLSEHNWLGCRVVDSKQVLLYRLVGCWNCLGCQQLKSYQDMYRLVTVALMATLLVQPHWMTRYPIQLHYPDIPITSHYRKLIMLRPGPEKRQVSIFNSLDWFDPGLNPWLRIYQNGRQTTQLIRFGHPVWIWNMRLVGDWAREGGGIARLQIFKIWGFHVLT